MNLMYEGLRDGADGAPPPDGKTPSITIYKNGEAVSLGCAPGAIAPGAGSVCGWDTSGDGYTVVYSAEAYYRSALDDDYYSRRRSFWFDGWRERPAPHQGSLKSW